VRPCLDCGTPSDASRCEEHQRDARRVYERGRKRPSRSKRWEKLSRSLRARSGFCEFCGTTSDLSVDHVQPVSLGGSMYGGPFRVLCKSCNAKAYATQRAESGVPPRTIGGTQPRGQASSQLHNTQRELPEAV
jgi:5-methylcytosine-specific restriction enzyme A